MGDDDNGSDMDMEVDIAMEGDEELKGKTGEVVDIEDCIPSPDVTGRLVGGGERCFFNFCLRTSKSVANPPNPMTATPAADPTMADTVVVDTAPDELVFEFKESLNSI